MKADPPLFSVVIPAYNASAYLAECVQSVLTQSDPDFEVIVVDDGSTDDTAALASAFTDPRLRVIRRENGGLAAARNTGIRAAVGELVAFLDADDRWLPDKLAAHRRALATDRLAAVSYDWAAFIDSHGQRTGLCMSQRRARLTHETLMVKNHLGNGSTSVVRRAVLEAYGGFDENLKRMVDQELWVRLAHAGEHFRLVPEVLSEYRIHSASFTADTGRMLKGVDAFLGKIAGFAPESVRRLAPLVYACTHRWMARAAFVAHDYPKARFHALSALRCDPGVLWHDPRAALTFAAIAVQWAMPTPFFVWLLRLGYGVVGFWFRRGIRSALVLGALLGGPAVFAQPTPIPTAPEPVALSLSNDSQYFLGPGDRLRITVYGNDDFSGEQVVLNDGRINLPLAGAVRVAGMSLEDVTAELTRRLVPYINRPQVAIAVVTPRPLRINIGGEVNQPGPQLLPLVAASTNPNASSVLTLSRALVVAGGITQRADLGNIELHRRLGDGSERVLHLDLWQNLLGKAEIVDPVLQDNDSIVVPRLSVDSAGRTALAARSSIAPLTMAVAVAGQVRTPGALTLSASRSALEAIMAAGGPVDGADLSSVLLFRQQDGKLETRTLNLDAARGGDNSQNPLLAAGDSLLVPKTGWQSFLDSASDILKPISQIVLPLRLLLPFQR